MYNKVNLCGINTSKLPSLSSKEKTALLKEAQSGNTAARELLIEGNLRLVLSVIQKFTGRGENPDDLFQVGCIGLIKAIDNFDITQNVLFSTYAVPMISGELRRYLRDNNIIHVSRSMRDLAYRALNVKERLSVAFGREPTIEEITEGINREEKVSAEEKGIPFIPIKTNGVTAALEAVVDPVSLYEPVFSEGGDSLYIMDQIKDSKSSAEIWTENIALKEAVEKLGEREKAIIKMRFFQGKTQVEAANELDISQAQISRLEKNALSKLKKQL